MEKQAHCYKSGTVALIGRPNSGKSTLLNSVLGRKVSITSPKPQTTRFNIQAVYEDNRGQIMFIDTPGIFGKATDSLSKRINIKAKQALSEKIDVLVYIIDHTRKRDFEENKIIGIMRTVNAPKILVINKIDVKKPTYRVQYMFLEEECDAVIEISALKRLNLNKVLNTIFSFLPCGKALVDTKDLAQPAINIDSRMFISEIIREKAFLFLRDEVPYTVTTSVDEITERESGTLYIKARILTTDDRYKGMIVGKGGRMIREISMAARKELEVASGKNVYLELIVDVDTHWKEQI